jgi:hypothetical protein
LLSWQRSVDTILILFNFYNEDIFLFDERYTPLVYKSRSELSRPKLPIEQKMSGTDDRAMGHYVTRSAGRMYAGPYGGNSVSKGPTVMEITTRELQFADSTSAVRFMDHVGSKQRSRQQASKARRTVLSAGNSD